jgi:hypothetical protein
MIPGDELRLTGDPGGQVTRIDKAGASIEELAGMIDCGEYGLREGGSPTRVARLTASLRNRCATLAGGSHNIVN